MAVVNDARLPLVQFVARPGIIDLAWGHPDPDLLPVDGLRAAAARVFDRYSADAVNYGYAAGPGPLIEWLGGRLGEVDGRAAAADEILISGGTSQALDHVATLFANAGDVALVESPTYHLAVRILRDHPVELVAIPTDRQGIRLDALQSSLTSLRKAGRRIAFLYTVPTFNNPTGASISDQRRRELVDLAARERLTIVEDDAYRELAYDGPAPPSLWSLSQPGTVIRLGSFAKSLAPGLRSGFITADARTIGRLADSGLLDSGGGISHFSSLVIAEYARTGDYARNVERLRSAYRIRRDALLSALASHIDGTAEWDAPHGGYFVWLTLRRPIDPASLRQAADQHGVGFMPDAPFYLDGASPTPSIRLSFSRYPPERLTEAARRLAKALVA